MGKIIIAYQNGNIKEIEFQNLINITQYNTYGTVIQANYVDLEGHNVQHYFSMDNLVYLELVPYPV